MVCSPERVDLCAFYGIPPVARQPDLAAAGVVQLSMMPDQVAVRLLHNSELSIGHALPRLAGEEKTLRGGDDIEQHEWLGGNGRDNGST